MFLPCGRTLLHRPWENVIHTQHDLQVTKQFLIDTKNGQSSERKQRERELSNEYGKRSDEIRKPEKILQIARHISYLNFLPFLTTGRFLRNESSTTTLLTFNNYFNNSSIWDGSGLAEIWTLINISWLGYWKWSIQIKKAEGLLVAKTVLAAAARLSKLEKIYIQWSCLFGSDLGQSIQHLRAGKKLFLQNWIFHSATSMCVISRECWGGGGVAKNGKLIWEASKAAAAATIVAPLLATTKCFTYWQRPNVIDQSHCSSLVQAAWWKTLAPYVLKLNSLKARSSPNTFHTAQIDAKMTLSELFVRSNRT